MGLAKTGLADTPGRNSGCPVSYDFDSLPPRKIYNVRASSFAIKINLSTCRAELSLYWRTESDFRRRRGKKRFLLLSRGRKKRIIIGRKRDLDSKEWSSGGEELRQDRYSEAFYYRLDGWNGRYGKGYLCKV